MEDPIIRQIRRKALLLDLTGKLAALLKEDGTEFDSLVELALKRLDDWEKLNAAFPTLRKKTQATKEFKKLSKEEIAALSEQSKRNYSVQLAGELARERELKKAIRKSRK